MITSKGKMPSKMKVLSILKMHMQTKHASVQITYLINLLLLRRAIKELSKIVKGSNLQKLFNLLIKNMIVAPKTFKRFTFGIWKIFFEKFERFTLKCSNFASSRDRVRLRSQVSNSTKWMCPKCFLVQNNFETKIYYRTENDIYRYISAYFLFYTNISKLSQFQYGTFGNPGGEVKKCGLFQKIVQKFINNAFLYWGKRRIKLPKKLLYKKK